MNLQNSFQVDSLTVTGFPPREGEAVALTALGLSSKEVARRMNCSARNVDNLKEAAKDRLLATNTPNLIAKSFHKGNLAFKAFCLSLFFAYGAFANTDPDDQARNMPRPVRTTRTRRKEDANPFRVIS